MRYSAPARMPAGQRAVTVSRRVIEAHAFGAVHRHVAEQQALPPKPWEAIGTGIVT
jgi:hypothetical protein